MRTMKQIVVLLALGALAFAVSAGQQTRQAKPSEPESLHEFVMEDIDGKSQSLAKYKGKVVLVVNVASRCGLTPQYEGLEKLYRAYKDKGLVILGFPANDFNGQEPGTNEEIKEFCTGKYDVTFPMFSKISVLGVDKHPLYQWLVDHTDDTEVDWNFHKFLVDRDGKVVTRFAARTKPDDKSLTTAILLALSTD